MRDIGILIWVALLIIGVTGSMISSVRRQMQASQGKAPEVRPARPQQVTRRVMPAIRQPAATPQPVPAAPSRPALKPKTRPEPGLAPPPLETHAPRADLGSIGARLFANRRSVLRAVIAAEVLGKPRAFNDEYTRY